jgi:Double zinc ribbon
MRYKVYVRVMSALGVGFFVLVAVLFLALLGPGSIGILVLLGILFVFTFWMSIAWAQRAVTEFGGSPFPGIWGILGVDIVPDDAGPPSDARTSSQTTSQLLDSSVGGSAAGTSAPELTQFRPVQRSVELSSVFSCPACGAITVGDDSRFCRACGAPVKVAAISTFPTQGCEKCGAITRGEGSKYCRKCGSLLGASP